MTFDIGLTLFVMPESAQRARALRTKSVQYRSSLWNLPVYILFIARLTSINHNYYITMVNWNNWTHWRPLLSSTVRLACSTFTCSRCGMYYRGRYCSCFRGLLYIFNEADYFNNNYSAPKIICSSSLDVYSPLQLTTRCIFCLSLVSYLIMLSLCMITTF